MKSRKPTHPGVILRKDILQPLGLTVTKAANMLGVTRNTLSKIVNEKSGISPDMAVRIGIATKTTPESWLQLQTDFDIWLAKQKKFTIRRFD